MILILYLNGMPTPLLAVGNVVKDTLYDVVPILLFAVICIQNPSKRRRKINDEYVLFRGNGDLFSSLI